MLRAAVLCLLSLPACGQNTAVDELFGEGVLGVKWYDSLEAVRAIHPDGKRSEGEQIGGQRPFYWTVRDARAVFEIERRRRDNIQFAFFAERLRSVFVMFSDCDEVVESLTKLLGPFDTIAPDPGSGSLRRNRGRWTGTKVNVDATRFFGDCLVTIDVPVLVPAQSASEYR
jgi:hypothetical protein